MSDAKKKDDIVKPETEFPEAPDVPRQPVEDDPAMLAELQRLQQQDAAPLEEEEKRPPPAPTVGEKDDIRAALSQMVENQRQLQEAVRQMAEANEQQIRSQRPPIHAEPERPAKSAWRTKLAEGNDKILEEAFDEMYQDRLARDIRPSLGYLFEQQSTLLEKELSRDYPHQQFGYRALKKDVDAYMENARRAGVTVDRTTAYQRVAFDVMNSSLLDAEADLQKRSREAKRREFVDTTAGVGREQQEGPEPLSADEKHAAWMTWPDKPRDEAEKLFSQHREGAVRDGLIEAEDRRERHTRR